MIRAGPGESENPASASSSSAAASTRTPRAGSVERGTVEWDEEIGDAVQVRTYLAFASDLLKAK